MASGRVDSVGAFWPVASEDRRRDRRNWALDIADYIRQDHMYLYAIIANPRMMLQRQAHWRRA